MDKVAPSDQELSDQVAVAEAASVSPLQTYVVGRLSGAEGPVWMDAQPIDQAAHVCKTIGICRIHGAHSGIKGLTVKQLHEAGAVGMEAASLGREGIFAILEEIAQKESIKRHSGRAPSALGRIYDWLQFDNDQDDAGPIKDVVRDFIIDHMPVEPGMVLFGSSVLKRKRHTVATLSKVSGVHRKTLIELWFLRGCLREGTLMSSKADELSTLMTARRLRVRLKIQLPSNRYQIT
ncbi:hypothetical protein [Roseobacter sp. N2S]|uniref:hypothetical protein n=1 Tax=Roseobacter sp. N2S TaxID=2663844 RepID=UPI0028570F7C|nr:hypothetical protein [Roseobacter sp. N2S]MDR6266398.1 hypothetical protein [Roseobacter sp. N2S]